MGQWNEGHPSVRPTCHWPNCRCNYGTEVPSVGRRGRGGRRGGGWGSRERRAAARVRARGEIRRRRKRTGAGRAHRARCGGFFPRVVRCNPTRGHGAVVFFPSRGTVRSRPSL